MKRFFAAAAACLLLIFCLSCQKAAEEKQTVSEDLPALAARLEEAGYPARYYTQGSEMLTALDRDMREAMNEPPEQALRGFLFAMDPTGGYPVLELFVFAHKEDAMRLFEHLKKSERFVAGESAIRRSGRVVYMGYLYALEQVENTAGGNE